MLTARHSRASQKNRPTYLSRLEPTKRRSWGDLSRKAHGLQKGRRSALHRHPFRRLRLWPALRIPRNRGRGERRGLQGRKRQRSRWARRLPRQQLRSVLRRVGQNGLFRLHRPSGICTAACSSSDDCQMHDWFSDCDFKSGSCVESCSMNDRLEAGPDEDKCHGRDDLVCELYSWRSRGMQGSL